MLPLWAHVAIGVIIAFSAMSGCSTAYRYIMKKYHRSQATKQLEKKRSDLGDNRRL